MEEKDTLKDERINKYVKEFSRWKTDLEPYWDQIDKNQEMYEFYKSEASETDSDVSLNTPFAIVESLVAKGNDTTIDVTVKAKGRNDMSDFEQWVSAILKDSIEDQDVADYVGTFRKIKEVFSREFYIKGNAFAEINYLYKTAIVNGKKKVVADNPYLKVLPYKTVIFNPSKQADSSNVYFIEKFVEWSELESQEQDKSGKGIYSNLVELKKTFKGKNKLQDSPNDDAFVVDGSKTPRKVAPIRLLERWEGAKLIVIANDKVIIREEYDPFKIGRCPLLVGINYKQEGRPYAYGEIDAIYKPVRAQDTIINQNIEIINKYLRDSVVVDPNGRYNLDNLMAVMQYGGVTYGDPKMIGNVPRITPPQQAFMQIDIMQQAIERAARFSPYASGVPSQATDKTKGTLGGIQAMQSAAEPNFQVKLDAIQDCFMRPIGRIYLQMIASLMGDNDIRYAILKGEKPMWVKATKGILLGQATLQDMVVSGMVTENDLAQFAQENGITPDQIQTKEMIFDVDWAVDVSLNSQSKTDKISNAQLKMTWVDWSRNMGVQFSPDRVATQIGHEIGVDDPEELYLSDEEKGQMQQKQMQEQQTQVQQSQQADQMKMQQQVQMEQMKQQAQDDQAYKQARTQAILEAMKQAPAIA